MKPITYDLGGMVTYLDYAIQLVGFNFRKLRSRGNEQIPLQKVRLRYASTVLSFPPDPEQKSERKKLEMLK